MPSTPSLRRSAFACLLLAADGAVGPRTSRPPECARADQELLPCERHNLASAGST